MIYKILVKPANESRQGWLLEHTHFHIPPHQHGPLTTVVDWEEPEDGIFLANLDLPDGINVLFFNMAMGARKLDIDMDPPAKITQGQDRDWPVTLETAFTHDIQTIVLRAGDDQ